MNESILEEHEPVVYTQPKQRLRWFIFGLLALCVLTSNASTLIFDWQPPLLTGSLTHMLQDVRSGSRHTRSRISTSVEATSVIFDQLYEPFKYAVQEIHVIEASNRDDAIRQCEHHLSIPIHTKDSTTGGFLPVGVNLILEEEEDLHGAVYLCQRRVQIQEASKDDYDPSLPILQWIAVLQETGGQCPQGTVRLTQPRPQVAVCIKYTTLEQAKATNIYVSDLMVSYAKQYNNDRPRWQTFPTSIHMSTASFSPDEERERLYGAFLSIKRSPASIVGLKIVQGDTWLQAAGKCYRSPNNSANVLEPAGGQGYFILDHGSIALICLEWSHVRNNPTKALLGVKSHFKGEKECPPGYASSSDSLLGDTSWEFCLLWGNPFKQASIGDFVFVQNDRLFPGLNWLQISSRTTSSKKQPRLRDDGGMISNDLRALLLYRKVRYRLAHHQVTSNNTVSNDETKDKPFVLGSPYFSEEELAESIAFATYQQKDPHRRRVKLRAVRNSQNDTNSLSFKVLVLSDIHSSGIDFMYCRGPMAMVETNCSERIMFDFFNDLLDLEKPQLVVFDGDNVHKMFGLLAIHSFMNQMEKRQIPWTMVFGNHDDEGFLALSRESMMEKMRQKEFAYIHPGPDQVDGVGNFALTIQASEDEDQDSQELVRLYFLDSHATADSTSFPQQNGKNDWIKPSQLDFYQALSSSLEQYMSTKVPGVLFFHIPLPEYSLSSPDEPNRVGGHFENIQAPYVNNGLFSMLVEQGHIKAIVVGHDHANDFCYQRDGIQLCYAGCPGFGLAYGRHDLPRQVRILEWKFDLEDKTKQELFAYKRVYGDETKSKKDFQKLYSVLRVDER